MSTSAVAAVKIVGRKRAPDFDMEIAFRRWRLNLFGRAIAPHLSKFGADARLRDPA